MRPNPTALILELAIKTLQKDVQPHLPPSTSSSNTAQNSYHLVVKLLTGLLARYTPNGNGTRPLLHSLVIKGFALESEIRSALGYDGGINADVADDASFEDLALKHQRLTDRISELCQDLGSSAVDKAPLLLRRAAEWETEYYTQSLKAIEEVSQTHLKDEEESEDSESAKETSSETDTKPTEKGGLPAEALQSFLQSARSDSTVEVSELSRLVGGHGKQSYGCQIKSSKPDSDASEELVIRKADKAPIILRGAFHIEEEFALLRDLSTNTDFPCPKPFDLASPPPEGVDAPFFTMSRVPGAISSMYLGKDSSALEENTAKQLAKNLAKLHTYSLDNFAGYFKSIGEDVEDVKRTTIKDRYKKSLDEWATYFKDVDHLPSPFLRWLLNWLQTHLPADDRTPVLSHGDYALHNILQKDGEVTGVLDWECAEFLSPEQDLAYLQPLLGKSYSWEKFLEHYREAGGPEVHEEYYPFAQAYGVLRLVLALNRATRNLEVGDSRDFRFLFVEFGYLASFMSIGLDYTAQHPSHKAIASAETNDNSEKQYAVATHAVRPDGHGPQANAFTVFGEDTMKRLPWGDTPNWQDSVVLVWWDDNNKIGGFHRLGHEPNRPNGGEAIIWTNIITPDAIFRHDYTNTLREADTPPDGSFGSGDDTCTVTYENGNHIWKIDHPADGVSANIIHRDTGPNVDCFPKRGSMEKDFSAAHFDIAGRVTGSMTFGGKTFDIQGLSLRDHAWGTRDWGVSAYGHRWLVGTAGENFSFVGVSWHATVTDRVANFGWVVRDGVVTLATEVDILLYMEVDSCSTRGGRLHMVMSTGEVFDIECESVTPKASVCWHLGMACVDRICRFTCKQNGIQGFADVESTSNAQMGTRKPGTLVGGVIENGITKF